MLSVKSGTHGEVLSDGSDEDYTEKHLAFRKREKRRVFMQKAQLKRTRAHMSGARNAAGNVSRRHTESLDVNYWPYADGVVK